MILVSQRFSTGFSVNDSFQPQPASHRHPNSFPFPFLVSSFALFRWAEFLPGIQPSCLVIAHLPEELTSNAIALEGYQVPFVLPQCYLLFSPPHCMMVSRSDATPCKTATRAALATGRFVLHEGEWAPLLTGLFGLGLFIGSFLLIGRHCDLSLFKGIWCQRDALSV